jgi:pantoate--beta-alanine ligase
MQLTIANDLGSLQQALIETARQGKRVGLVPTMGALHEGHQALINIARQRADAVVVSVFVNPTQFGPDEDFEKYPRRLEQDIKKTSEAGASIVYTPSVDDMYGPGHVTSVSPGPLGEILCGQFRPGHFEGVATVVTKLLLRVLPHVAVFGEKDYQQLCVIRQLVYDLDIPIEILGAPTVREKDGLALSSRNAYLTPQERKTAPRLYEILQQTGKSLAGGMNVREALAMGKALLAQAGFKIDYLELRTSYTLHALDVFEKPSRLLVAAWLGNTRLIDNFAMEEQ